MLCTTTCSVWEPVSQVVDEVEELEAVVDEDHVGSSLTRELIALKPPYTSSRSVITMMKIAIIQKSASSFHHVDIEDDGVEVVVADVVDVEVAEVADKLEARTVANRKGLATRACEAAISRKKFSNSVSSFSRIVSSFTFSIGGSRRRSRGCSNSFLKTTKPQDIKCISGGEIIGFVRASAVMLCVGTSIIQRIQIGRAHV